MVILSFIGIINLHSALIKVRFTTQIGVRMTGDYIKDISAIYFSVYRYFYIIYF